MKRCCLPALRHWNVESIVKVHKQKLTVFEVSVLRGIYGVKRKCFIDKKINYSTVNTDMWPDNIKEDSSDLDMTL